MRPLLALAVLLCLQTAAFAYGGIPWSAVHTEIAAQDKELIAFIDQTFDVAPGGGAMRPLIGEHAGERFAPYTFDAKLKGTKGDYTFKLTFDGNREGWSVSVEKIKN